MVKRFFILVAVLALMLAAAVPAAFAQQQTSATGVLRIGLPADVGGLGTHSISDEATGELYALRSAGADLDSYVDQQVTVYGALTPGKEGSGEEGFGGSGTLPSIDVTRVEPAGGPIEGKEITATFELAVECEPPAGTTFFAGASQQAVGLDDPDGDGTYTGTLILPAGFYDLGAFPVPVAILSGTPEDPQQTIKEFGEVVLEDGDNFSAGVSYCDDDGSVNGAIEGSITSISGSVVLVEEDPSAEDSGEKGYFTVTGETEITKQEEGKQVEAGFEDLEVGQIVEAAYAEGGIAASYPTQGNAASIAILEELTCMLPEGCDDGGTVEPPAPGDKVEATGTIRDLANQCNECHHYALTDEASGTDYGLISDPSSPRGGVDLSSYAGQRVTVYGILQAIGENLLFVTRVEPAGGPGQETVTVTFELTAEGEPPTNATFFGHVGDETYGYYVTLADPDGDGIYTGSQDFGKAGQMEDGPSGGLPFQIVQGTGSEGPDASRGYAIPGEPAHTIKDFGLVKLDEDKTLSASVSFENGGSGSVDSGSKFLGNNTVGVIRGLLPSTGGGVALATLLAGSLLVAGGFLIRRIVR